LAGLVEGKSIVVTGAGSGIGEAIATDLAAEGAKVAVADINIDTANRVAAAIGKKGGTAIAVAVNVTDRASVRAMIAAAVKAFGRLDVIFNNAGISKARPFLETDEEDWRRIIDVNGLGVLIGTQEAARQFIAQKGGGKIINTASIVGEQADAIAAVYSASKSTVISLTQSAAKELGGFGITVNCFSPGFVKTTLWDGLDNDLMSAGIRSERGLVDHLAKAKAVLGRVSTPNDLTGTTTFLASSRSDYITGHNLLVDGGVLFI
jgi:meso-butanediol dehydrogenase/(S,S)-butanediol dehydrogenase/diacetyl reductase